MTPGLRARLSLLFFAQYLATGAWFVPLGAYMSKTLGFDDLIGAAYSMVGLATICSTLFVGMLADRYFAPGRLLAVLELFAGLTLLLMATARGQTAFLAATFVHCLFYTCTIPLAASLAFASMRNPAEFPGVRVFGSLGFIAAGLLVGSIRGAGISNLPLLIGAAIHCLTAAYALTLPGVKPQTSDERVTVAGLFGLDVVKRVRSISFWVLMAAVFLMVIPKKFYDAYLNTFLVERGVHLTIGALTLEPTAIQTAGQVAEMATLLLLPALMSRIGIKGVMLIGMAGWIGRFLLWSSAPMSGTLSVTMIVAGILMHGLSYDFFFVSGQIWVDRQFDARARARAQSFYWFVLSGAGVVFGSNVAGAIYRHFPQGAGDRWPMIWNSAAAITSIVAVLFACFFGEKRVGDGESARSKSSAL